MSLLLLRPAIQGIGRVCRRWRNKQCHTLTGCLLQSTVCRPAVATIQILDFSFCAFQPTSPISAEVADILQIIHGGVMCTFAIVQFMRQSLQMHRATKQWQLNRYMILLIREGILYFIVYVLLSSFPCAFSYAIRVRKFKFTNRANSNPPLQYLHVCPRRCIEFLRVSSDRRMAADIGVHPANCAHVHSSPSIHFKHAGVVRAGCSG